MRRWRRTPMNQLTPLQRKKAFEHIAKRKRKKRRKRKTPKTSSSPAVRTQKSGHSSTSSSWYVYSGGVMSSVVCGSSILLGMYWLPQHSANSALDCAYCWSYGVKVATFIRTWWRTRAVLPSLLAGFAGYDTPRAVFPSIVDACGDSTGVVLRQGDMPVVVPSGASGHTAQKTLEIPQVQFLFKVYSPVAVVASAAYGQTAQKTVEIPQLPFLDKFVLIYCRGAEADSHGPDCSSDHRDPPLAVLDRGDQRPCCAGRAASLWWSQLQFSDTLVTSPLFFNNGCLGFDSAE